MDKDLVKQFSDKVFTDMAGAMTVGMAYVGAKTGIFRAMAGKGPMDPDQVVAATGLQPRYVLEWLNGMTVAGYLDYEPPNSYRLPDEHAYLLASEGSDHDMSGLFWMAPVLLGVAPKVADAFQRGGGVPFEEFGSDCVAGLDRINRGQYEQRLAGYWLQTLPDVIDRLQKGARVLDVGCGAGRVCLALAKAFPHADVLGIDPDP